MTRTDRQRGSVLLVVLVILVALLAGGGVALYVQLAGTRGSGLIRFSRAALTCAEAGLQATRKNFLCNYGSTSNWGTILDPSSGTPPAWYTPLPTTVTAQLTDLATVPGYGIVGDAGDGGTTEDWVVWAVDDEDEFVGTLNPDVDNNLRIMVHSRCLMFPDQPREVVEVIRANPKQGDYENKGKGSGNIQEQTTLDSTLDPCL